MSDRLPLLLSEQQELSVRAARLSEHPVTVDSLARAGLAAPRRRPHRVRARGILRLRVRAAAHAQRRSLLGLLRSGEQHLFRRAQVRQILALEREQERGQYLGDVREILAADDMRPAPEGTGHQRWSRWCPTLAWTSGKCCGVLGDRQTARSPSSACWLAAQAPGFSRLLLDKRHHRRATSSDPGTADLGTWLCTLMARAHPDEVACLLRPYGAGQDGWAGRLVRVLNAAPLDRSEQMVTLMIAVIDAGGLDEAVRDPSRRGGDFFTLMHSFKGESAASGLLAGRGVAAPPPRTPDRRRRLQPAPGTHRDRARLRSRRRRRCRRRAGRSSRGHREHWSGRGGRRPSRRRKRSPITADDARRRAAACSETA